MILTTFEHQDTTWKVQLVYEGCYRIIDPYGSWFLLKDGIAKTTEEAIELAKPKIDRVFAKGFPNTNPWVGDTFVVLADEIGFRVGTHSQNFNGTGSVTAKKGDILIFDREGEDNGFWDIQGENYNPNNRGKLQGSRPWHLIYDEKIQQLYEYESFKQSKAKSRAWSKERNK